MLLSVVAIVVGLVVLAKASDRFVVSAASTASRLGISAVVVGAVVVGLGTSLPEMLVSGLAAASGNAEVGVGNVLGSNIANLSLVLGVVGLLAAVKIGSSVLRRELPLAVAATAGFAIALIGGLSRVDGVILVAGLVATLILIVKSSSGATTDALAVDVEAFVAEEVRVPVWREAALLVAGLVGTLGGAQALVWGALRVADDLGLSGGFVGLTIVAIGTSLPELVTAVQAARRGEDELIVGNLLGSNIFNALSVGGLVALVAPTTTTVEGPLAVAAVAMVGFALAAAFFMRRRRAITRVEAVALLAGYVILLPFLA